VRITDADRASSVLAEFGLANIPASDVEVSAQIGKQMPEAVNRALVLPTFP